MTFIHINLKTRAIMKHVISLYRIVRHDADYRVIQGYRIVTNQDICIPFGYTLNGVQTDPQYDSWFSTAVVPIVEHHNGDRMFDTWSYSQLEDPDHVTIAMCIDDVLIAPDLLQNTTCFLDEPKHHLSILRGIGQAIQEFIHRKVKLPPICAMWWLEKEIEFTTTKRSWQQMCT